MTQGVRTYLALDANSAGIFYHDAPYLAVGEPSTVSVKKKGRIAPISVFSFLKEHSFQEIRFQGIDSFISDRNDPFLFPFPACFDKTLFQIYIVGSKACHFAYAQAARIEQFKDGPVPDRQESEALRGLDEIECVVDRQEIRQVSGSLWSRHEFGLIDRDISFSVQVVEKRY